MFFWFTNLTKTKFAKFKKSISEVSRRNSGRELSLYRSHRRRDSSADTSKDIEDIEDLELDDNDDKFSDKNDIEDGRDDDYESTDIFSCDIETRDKRLHGLMSSPDLAYCSMEVGVLELIKGCLKKTANFVIFCRCLNDD